MKVRFGTYNVRNCLGLDGRMSPRRISGVLGGLDVDVAGLNEVLRLFGRASQADDIADRLGFERHYSELQRYPWSSGAGIAVIGRPRIVAVEEIELPSGRERRQCLLATLETDSVRFRFAATHLSLGRTARTKAIAQLAAELPADLPLVLAGDFNCPPRDLAALAERMTLASVGKTFPSWRPMSELDHVLYSEHWRLVEAHAARSSASDHLPVVVELELTGG